MVIWMVAGWCVALALALWPWWKGLLPGARRGTSPGGVLRAGAPARPPWLWFRRERATTDPLVALEIQIRLAELACRLQLLEQDPTVYARSHHIRSTLAAYDALLREACVLAGLPVPEQPPVGTPLDSSERMRRELELSARGWSW